MRAPHRPGLEWQERTHKIWAAARKGRTATDIADAYQLPVAAVQRMLAPVEHPRLSDPVDLIRTGHGGPGKASANVQLYWFGFLTAAGRILGQGTLFTLVVTLGEGSHHRIDRLVADLAKGHVRCEFCHSSLVGWQVYLRDRALCQALVPWGVPSDLYGADPTVLDDLPEDLVVPFMRGYVDGSERGRRGRAHRRTDRFSVRGTPAVLAGINALIQRGWGISSGVVTQTDDGPELRFPDSAACQAIENRLNAVDAQLPGRTENLGRW